MQPFFRICLLGVCLVLGSRCTQSPTPVHQPMPTDEQPVVASTPPQASTVPHDDTTSPPVAAATPLKTTINEIPKRITQMVEPYAAEKTPKKFVLSEFETDINNLLEEYKLGDESKQSLRTLALATAEDYLVSNIEAVADIRLQMIRTKKENDPKLRAQYETAVLKYASPELKKLVARNKLATLPRYDIPIDSLKKFAKQ
jgi:hypothetical protein